MSNETKEMGFLEHLEELRWRFIRIIIAIVVGGVIVFFLPSFLFDSVIFGPMKADFFTYRAFCSMSHALGLGEGLCFGELKLDLQSIAMVSQITMHIVASLIAGLIISFPYVFYQFWAFILPGLKDNERSMAKGMTIWVSILFAMGVLFGYFMIVPLSVQFLGNYQVSDLVSNNITISSYVTTVSTLTLATGILFQLPVLVYILSKLGLITPALLKTYRRHALVGVLVLSAIITPPDIASQVLVTFPIMILYEVSIWISRRVERKLAKKNKAK